MRYLTLLLFAVLSYNATAQEIPHFIELVDGDTIYGKVISVDALQIRFQAEGRSSTTVVAPDMVRSYSYQGKVVMSGGKSSVVNNQISTVVNPAQESINLAGLKLQRSANLFYAGATITIIGVAGSVIGAILINNAGSSATSASVGRTVTYVGAGLSVVGSVVGMTAFIPISEAGIQLQKVRLGK
jgi:hypothetical protein